jgi:hypothetical protein
MHKQYADHSTHARTNIVLTIRAHSWAHDGSFLKLPVQEAPYMHTWATCWHKLSELQVIEHIVELMTDPFGNYLCQKLLDHCNETQRAAIVQRVAPHLISISLNVSIFVYSFMHIRVCVDCFSATANEWTPGYVLTVALCDIHTPLLSILAYYHMSVSSISFQGHRHESQLVSTCIHVCHPHTSACVWIYSKDTLSDFHSFDCHCDLVWVSLEVRCIHAITKWCHAMHWHSALPFLPVW